MQPSKISFSFLAAVLMAVVMFSCEPDKKPAGDYAEGVFIVNEGAYQSSNASVSFYSYSQDAVSNNIFRTVNGRDLGDVAQSIAVHNSDAFIVVNNSDKIEVVDKNTFQEKALITGVSLPRYFAGHGNRGYVSCWGDNSIKVIDLTNHQLVNSIPVATGPEKMLILHDKLYVVNTGGYGNDSILSIIDLESETVVKSLVVKDSPCDLVADASGNVWVLTAGKIVYGPEDPWPVIEETSSKLYKIDAGSDEISMEVTLFEDQHPRHLETDAEGNLFIGGGFGFGGIYRWDVPDGSTILEQIVADFAYGFNIDPASNILFVLNAPSFTDAGVLNRYDTEGNLLGTYECGIGPNSAGFKKAE